MGRMPTPIGTYGVIRVEKIPSTKRSKTQFEASARFRMEDGTSPRVRRRAQTQTQAIARLKKALSEREAKAMQGDIDRDTRFTYVVDLWLEELEEEATLGNLSHTTVRLYRSVLKNWALSSLGQLQCREVVVTRCAKVVKNARAKASYDTAKTVKAALSGICDYAVRHGAMGTNPMRSIGRMTRGKQKSVVTLTAAQRVDLLTKLREYGPTRQTDASGRSLGPRGQIWLDIPDLMEAMLSTGVRIGEALA